jgi:hypothetical protein
MTICQFQPNNKQQAKAKCPKHMKMPKYAKIFAALGPFKTQAEKNHYVRTIGLANHEYTHRVKKVYPTRAPVLATAAVEPDVE